jgi:hypothetical protein
MIRLKIVHVNRVPKLAENLGTLVAARILEGSIRELSVGEFEDSAGSGRWRLTSVAHSDPGNGATVALAFMRLGDAELSVGMELQPVAGPE